MRRLHLSVAAAVGVAIAVGGSPAALERAGAAAAGSARLSVRKIVPLTEEGGRLDWSEELNLIAFDRKGRDGFLDIWTMRPDGSDQRCLTCDAADIPDKHVGNPAWHPSGRYIAFQAQNDFKGFGRITDYFANPGAGINNDLWIMDRSSRKAWRVTKVEPRKGGVLHPQFSRDGRRLAWSERVDSRGGKWGRWSLRVADFVVSGGTPRVERIEEVEPGEQRQFYESHGFTPDGRGLLFSGNLGRGQDIDELDIYRYDLATKRLVNLTQTRDQWDEHAHYSPRGDRILWMSSRDSGFKVRAWDLRTDYWVMDADGGNKYRLTYFNDEKHAHHMKDGVTAADAAWSPDGRQIAAYLIVDVKKGGRIVRLDLDEGSESRTSAR